MKLIELKIVQSLLKFSHSYLHCWVENLMIPKTLLYRTLAAAVKLTMWTNNATTIWKWKKLLRNKKKEIHVTIMSHSVYIYIIHFRISAVWMNCIFIRGISASCSGTHQISKRMAQGQPEGASIGKKSRGQPPTRIEVNTRTDGKYEILLLFLMVWYAFGDSEL